MEGIELAFDLSDRLFHQLRELVESADLPESIFGMSLEEIYGTLIVLAYEVKGLRRTFPGLTFTATWLQDCGIYNFLAAAEVDGLALAFKLSVPKNEKAIRSFYVAIKTPELSKVEQYDSSFYNFNRAVFLSGLELFVCRILDDLSSTGRVKEVKVLRQKIFG